MLFWIILLTRSHILFWLIPFSIFLLKYKLLKITLNRIDVVGKDIQTEWESIVKSHDLRNFNSNVRGWLISWGILRWKRPLYTFYTGLKRRMRKLTILKGEEDTQESGNLWGLQVLEPETQPLRTLSVFSNCLALSYSGWSFPTQWGTGPLTALDSHFLVSPRKKGVLSYQLQQADLRLAAAVTWTSWINHCGQVQRLF